MNIFIIKDRFNTYSRRKNVIISETVQILYLIQTPCTVNLDNIKYYCIIDLPFCWLILLKEKMF